ncbi:hypothetical protein N7536_002685 [Penicillium majusculum]|uniref:Uncharacterized protein n=1 Tax=Penicillium solitum TaxID=60172 RepID=A0A1V6RBA3_9EURO|nr:uncharacterized protein PENSOL_c009G12113 [Penicillium solitum]KAJ5699672.1 hypothetical protein N7536_002685 [Penicillium majusculum]OQD98452.1 hypothetical protein PENSOL_c009G12113 [Penicillium solitum]
MGPGFAQHVTGLKGTEAKSLADLMAFNRKFPKRSYSEENPARKYLESALDQKMTLEEYQDALLGARKIAIEEGIIETLDSYNLDALVLPAWTEMSIYAAWVQAPTATVPLGKYRDGKPYGLRLVAPRFDDGKLLQIMNLYEKAFPPRAVPKKMRWKRWERFLARDYL